MCGRYALHGPFEALRTQFGLRTPPALEDRYNIAPSAPVLTIGPDREATLVRWGLRANGTVANVRDDSCTQRPWARALLRTRCVIPVSGFYEWRAPASPRGRKQPFYATASDARYLAFAGALAQWDALGATLFTTAANRTMAPVHDRMPVLLDAHGVAAWLEPSTSPDALLALLRPAPDDALRVHPVGAAVGNPRSQGAALIAPVALDEPPGLFAD